MKLHGDFRRPRIVRFALQSVWMLPAAAGAACPEPPFDRTVAYQGTVAWYVDGEVCQLQSSLNAGGGSAVATAAYQLSASTEPFRIGFRLDHSQLGPLTPPYILENFGILSVTSSIPATADNQKVSQTLLSASLVSAGDGFHLAIGGACQSQGLCSIVSQSVLNPSSNHLRFEIVMGGLGTGRLRYWVNDTYDVAPTGELLLDNAAWGAPASVALGLQSAASYFYMKHPSQPLIFDQIEVKEASIFWDNFESWHTAH